MAGHQVRLLEVDQPPQANGKVKDKIQMLPQDDQILMTYQPVIKIEMEFDSMMTNVLYHLPQNHHKDLRGRAEAKRQSPERVGLCWRHLKMKDMLGQLMGTWKYMCVRSIDTDQLPGVTTLMIAHEVSSLGSGLWRKHLRGLRLIISPHHLRHQEKICI